MMKRRFPDSIWRTILSSNAFAVVVFSFPERLRVTMSAVLRSVISIAQTSSILHIIRRSSSNWLSDGSHTSNGAPGDTEPSGRAGRIRNVTEDLAHPSITIGIAQRLQASVNIVSSKSNPPGTIWFELAANVIGINYPLHGFFNKLLLGRPAVRDFSPQAAPSPRYQTRPKP